MGQTCTRSPTDLVRGLEVLHGLPHAVIVIDEEGRMEWSNPGVERLLGYSRAEVQGRGVEMLVADPAIAAHHSSFIKRFLTTGDARIIGTRGRRVEARCKDGSVLPVLLTVTVLERRGEGASRTRFLGTLTDLLRHEEEFQRVRDEATARREMLAYISHEIRVPMHGISMALDLADEETGALDAETLQAMRLSADTAMKVLNGVMDVEKLRAGHPLPFAEFSLAEFLEACAARAQLYTRVYEGVEFSLDVSGLGEASAHAVTVTGAEVQLGQCVSNFVSNACKFSQGGGSVVVFAELFEDDNPPSPPARRRASTETHGSDVRSPTAAQRSSTTTTNHNNNNSASNIIASAVGLPALLTEAALQPLPAGVMHYNSDTVSQAASVSVVGSATSSSVAMWAPRSPHTVQSGAGRGAGGGAGSGSGTSGGGGGSGGPGSGAWGTGGRSGPFLVSDSEGSTALQDEGKDKHPSGRAAHSDGKHARAHTTREGAARERGIRAHVSPVVAVSCDGGATATPRGAVAVQRGTWLRLGVRDSGIGMAADQLAKLFVPFEQLPNFRTRRGEGSGLGLALSKVVIEDGHGGRIGVSSAGVGAGSCFYFDLPPSCVRITASSSEVRMTQMPGPVHFPTSGRRMLDDGARTSPGAERIDGVLPSAELEGTVQSGDLTPVPVEAGGGSSSGGPRRQRVDMPTTPNMRGLAGPQSVSTRKE